GSGGGDGADRRAAGLGGGALRGHRHDTYAIGVTEAGVQAFDYRGRAEHSTPGQVVVLHPDEMHDGRAGSRAGFGYRIVYVEPALIAAAVRTIRGRPTALPFAREPVSGSPMLAGGGAAALPAAPRPPPPPRPLPPAGG